MVGDKPGGNILRASVFRSSSCCCLRRAISLFKLDKSGVFGREEDETEEGREEEEGGGGGRGGEAMPRSPRAC